MSPFDLYELLDNAGVDYEIIEIFEGARILNIVVDEPTDEELDEQYTDNPQKELT